MIKVPDSSLAPLSPYVPGANWSQRTVHLGGYDGSSEDTSADGDHAGEGALLVDVRALDGGLGRPESQSNILIPSPVPGVLARATNLVVEEDMGLQARIPLVWLERAC